MSQTARVGETGPVEPRSFDELYQSRYREMVQIARLATGSNALAEELVQDAFAAMYQRYESIRKPDAYLRRAVTMRCTSWVRRRVVERRYLDRHRPEPDWSHDPDTLHVMAALEKLSARHRMVLVLRYLSDWSEPDVAAALGCRPVAVRSLLARARTQLAKELGA